MNKKGQSIVEMALVFPVVLFVFAVVYQLILLVRTEIELHQSAYHIAYQVAVGKSATSSLLLEAAKLELANSRWGVLGLYRSSVEKQPLPQWQSYTGFETLDNQGALVKVHLIYYLFGHTYINQVIPWMTLNAECDLPVEPTVPS